jgi:hypothetical protein
MRLAALALSTLAATAVALALAGTAGAATPTHRDDTVVRCGDADDSYPGDDGPVVFEQWHTVPRRYGRGCYELHRSPGWEHRARVCDRVEAVPAEPARPAEPRLLVPSAPTRPRAVVPAEPTWPGHVVPAEPVFPAEPGVAVPAIPRDR